MGGGGEGEQVFCRGTRVAKNAGRGGEKGSRSVGEGSDKNELQDGNGADLPIKSRSAAGQRSEARLKAK